MPRLTVTITEEQDELLEEITGDGGEYESKSAAVRDFISSGDERHELRQKVDRLQNEKRTIIQQREEHQSLVRYVEEERSLQQRREERETAPVWQRLKWWVVGAPSKRS